MSRTNQSEPSAPLPLKSYRRTCLLLTECWGAYSARDESSTDAMTTRGTNVRALNYVTAARARNPGVFE